MIRHAWNLLHQKAKYARWTWNFLSGWRGFFYIPAKGYCVVCTWSADEKLLEKSSGVGEGESWEISRRKKYKVLVVLNSGTSCFLKGVAWRAPVFFKGFPSFLPSVCVPEVAKCVTVGIWVILGSWMGFWNMHMVFWCFWWNRFVNVPRAWNWQM